MSWKPAFELGLWNAWIPTLFVVLHPFLMQLIDLLVGTGNIYSKMGEVPRETGEKKAVPIPGLLLILISMYSIFLPLQPGTHWFYAGLVLYLAGVAMFLDAIVVAAKTPPGQVFSRGIYRNSRHPLYLSFIFIFLGISRASVSWLFLLLSIGWMVFPLSQVKAEEQGCLEMYGAAYQEYLVQTPKWLGRPHPGQLKPG